MIKLNKKLSKSISSRIFGAGLFGIYVIATANFAIASAPTFQVLATWDQNLKLNPSGVAANKQGLVAFAGYQKPHTLSFWQPSQNAPQIAAQFPKSARISGLKWRGASTLYATDYTNHRLFRVDVATTPPKIEDVSGTEFPQLYQPNDFTFAGDNLILFSDPKWGETWTGRIYAWDIAAKQGGFLDLNIPPCLINGIVFQNSSQSLFFSCERKATKDSGKSAAIMQLPLNPSEWRKPHKPDSFYASHTGLDGMAICNKQLLVTQANRGEIFIFSLNQTSKPPRPAVLDVRSVGVHPSNVACAGRGKIAVSFLGQRRKGDQKKPQEWRKYAILRIINSSQTF